MRAFFVALVLACRLAAPAQEASPTAPQPNSILNLYDAFGYQKKGTVLDWGFSVLVRYNGRTILFDAGNDAGNFAHNVKALGVDLQKVDLAVLSHRHADHASGFDYVMNVKPGVKAFVPKDPLLSAPIKILFSRAAADQVAGLPPEQLYFGGKMNSMDFRWGGRFTNANVEYVAESREIEPGVYLVFTRSPLLREFNGYPPSEPGHPDLVGMPEISLALQTSRGGLPRHRRLSLREAP